MRLSGREEVAVNTGNGKDGDWAGFHVRAAEARDEDAVRTLMTAGGMGMPPDWQQAMVAVNDATDRPVGYLRVQCTDKGPHVAPVAVFPYWRGRGIGRALMEDALERHGALKLVARGEAAGFYRKLGFREIPFDGISGDLEEDCGHCPERPACHPVAFERQANPLEEASIIPR